MTNEQLDQLEKFAHRADDLHSQLAVAEAKVPALRMDGEPLPYTPEVLGSARYGVADLPSLRAAMKGKDLEAAKEKGLLKGVPKGAANPRVSGLYLPLRLEITGSAKHQRDRTRVMVLGSSPP